MGITVVITPPRSPWQNSYAERVISSIRRECLDHIVIFNQRHLRRVLSFYVDYYRNHALIFRSARIARTRVQFSPRRIGRVVALPKDGGLHHGYERLAA